MHAAVIARDPELGLLRRRRKDRRAVVRRDEQRPAPLAVALAFAGRALAAGLGRRGVGGAIAPSTRAPRCRTPRRSRPWSRASAARPRRWRVMAKASKRRPRRRSSPKCRGAAWPASDRARRAGAAAGEAHLVRAEHARRRDRPRVAAARRPRRALPPAAASADARARGCAAPSAAPGGLRRAACATPRRRAAARAPARRRHARRPRERAVELGGRGHAPRARSAREQRRAGGRRRRRVSPPAPPPPVGARSARDRLERARPRANERHKRALVAERAARARSSSALSRACASPRPRRRDRPSGGDHANRPSAARRAQRGCGAPTSASVSPAQKCRKSVAAHAPGGGTPRASGWPEAVRAGATTRGHAQSCQRAGRRERRLVCPYARAVSSGSNAPSRSDGAADAPARALSGARRGAPQARALAQPKPRRVLEPRRRRERDRARETGGERGKGQLRGAVARGVSGPRRAGWRRTRRASGSHDLSTGRGGCKPPQGDQTPRKARIFSQFALVALSRFSLDSRIWVRC